MLLTSASVESIESVQRGMVLEIREVAPHTKAPSKSSDCQSTGKALKVNRARLHYHQGSLTVIHNIPCASFVGDVDMADKPPIVHQHSCLVVLKIHHLVQTLVSCASPQRATEISQEEKKIDSLFLPKRHRPVMTCLDSQVAELLGQSHLPYPGVRRTPYIGLPPPSP